MSDVSSRTSWRSPAAIDASSSFISARIIATFERMDEVGLARGAELVAVLVRRDDVRAAQQVLVQARVVGLDLLEDVLEAQHGPIIGAEDLSG